MQNCLVTRDFQISITVGWFIGCLCSMQYAELVFTHCFVINGDVYSVVVSKLASVVTYFEVGFTSFSVTSVNLLQSIEQLELF